MLRPKLVLLLTDVLSELSLCFCFCFLLSLSLCFRPRAWETRRLLYYGDTGSHVVRATAQQSPKKLTSCSSIVHITSLLYLKWWLSRFDLNSENRKNSDGGKSGERVWGNNSKPQLAASATVTWAVWTDAFSRRFDLIASFSCLKSDA